MEQVQCNSIDLMTYSTGNCSESVRVSVESHLRQCESCRTKLETLRAERETFLSEMPFDSVMESAPKTARIIPFPVRRAVSAAAALFVVVLTFTQMDRISNRDQFAMKGSADLTIVAENPDGSVAPRTNPVYVPGERIQLCYSLPESSYIAVVSVDGTGAVSRWYPSDGTQSSKVAPGAMVPLSFSIRLDEYIGKEHYLLFVSSQPIDLTTIDQLAIAQSGGTPVKFGTTGDTVLVKTIEKQVSHE